MPAGHVQVREALSILSWLEKRSWRRGLRGKGSQRRPGDVQLLAHCLWWWWWCWATRTFQDKEKPIVLGQYLLTAAARGVWMNGSIFFFIDLGTEGLQWLSFLIKRTLVWWIIAWLFAVSRDVGGTALHVRDWINRSGLHIHIQLQKSHQHFCWSPTNPHLLKALLNRLYYGDIVISFLSKTQNYRHLFADVLKCAYPDCRLIAHNLSVQDSNKLLSF